jgi:hypothetical protein
MWNEFRPSQDADSFFTQVPKPMGVSGARPTPRERELAADRRKAAIGK